MVQNYHLVAVLLLLLCYGNNVLSVDGFETPQQKRLSRRDCLAGAAVTGLSTLLWPPEVVQASAATAQPFLLPPAYNVGVMRPEAGRFYFPTLTPPFRNRAKVRYDLGRGMWALEQLLAFGNVTATIRTTVVQLSNQDLWVHSPQWPTGEFCALLNEIPGRVAHIVLPCNALEHKAPMKDFCRKYPSASVWISPRQYGPFGACDDGGGDFDSVHVSRSMGYRVDGILSGATLTPWSDEFEYSTLQIDLPQNAGPVTEVAFFHKPTKTLIATDATIFVPRTLQQSTLYETYFDQATVREDPTFWPRTVLQSVFLPLRYDETSSSGYPGFDAIAERLVRAPILRGFNDARGRDETVQWVNGIVKWQFDRIVASHFASPVAATPRDFQAAFAHLYSNDEGSIADQHFPPIACRDWELLDSLNEFIAKYKLGAPSTFDYKKDCR